MTPQLGEKTIADFGKQWTRYRDNEGYYGSLQLFADMIYPHLQPENFRGKRVAEIGSGTGRIVNMMLAADAAHVLAVEPSQAFDVLQENTHHADERVSSLRCKGDEIPPDADLDILVSIGVLHHIPEPQPVVRAAYRALRPGGRMLVWLYGKEGNELYLSLVQPLRWLGQFIPDAALRLIAAMLVIPLSLYVGLCRWLPLPLSGYMTNVIGKFDLAKRRLVIYDQLNPAYAKYYTKAEAEALLRDAGFRDVSAYHRHGYSWTVVGTKN